MARSSCEDPRRAKKNAPASLGIFLTLAAVWLLDSVSVVHAQTLNDPKLHVREVVAGLSQPTAMAFIGLRDILVLQKNDGKVRRVIDGVLQSGSVLDVAVDIASERGLLGIAVHPNFPATPFIYLYYTQSNTSGDTNGSPLANRVYRYTWNGSALVNAQQILDLPVTPGPNHDGGTMTFGPDGKLYVVIGDLNRDGQLQNKSSGAAPDDSGVIFRINDDGSAPADNPFFDSMLAQGGALAKYYAYGVRNSFGLTFDPVTGELWDTENGPSNYDEINLVLPGLNSGWNKIMGPDGRDQQNVSDLVQFPGSHYADPKFSWLSTVGPTALVFMSSPRLGPDYQDDLFAGDINNGRLYRFRVNTARDGFLFNNPDLADLVADDSTELQEVILGTGFGGISDLKVGPDGLLYVLSLGLGKIFVVSTQAVQVDFDGDGKSDVGIARNILWSIRRSFDDAIHVVSGLGFIPLPADYDGDGIADVAGYHLSGFWNVAGSSGLSISNLLFGGPSFTPVPADFDGDGKADLAVYSDGAWSILRSSDNGNSVVAHGGVGWLPVPADYDGDGKADITVYIDGAWSIVRSSDGGNTVVGHGGPGFIPVPGDYDGDGKADIAVYIGGAWSIKRSSDNGITIVGHGGPGFEPVPADYDGDGKTDIAVYNANGAWSIIRSSDNGNTVVGHGGAPHDVPLN